MAAIKKILVPIDFSQASRHAVQYACTLADTLGASIVVLHAIDHAYLAGGYTEFYALPDDFYDRVERQAQLEFESLLTAGERDKYHAAFVLREGRAAHEILEYLREHHDVDLVVMATHGRGGVARLMMGSVTDRVVRAAPCPVVTIRGPEPATAPAKTAA
jgi:nucleotide-binding universal stress UspA family protein